MQICSLNRVGLDARLSHGGWGMYSNQARRCIGSSRGSSGWAARGSACRTAVFQCRPCFTLPSLRPRAAKPRRHLLPALLTRPKCPMKAVMALILRPLPLLRRRARAPAREGRRSTATVLVLASGCRRRTRTTGLTRKRWARLGFSPWFQGLLIQFTSQQYLYWFSCQILDDKKVAFQTV